MSVWTTVPSAGTVASLNSGTGATGTSSDLVPISVAVPSGLGSAHREMSMVAVALVSCVGLADDQYHRNCTGPLIFPANDPDQKIVSLSVGAGVLTMPL